MLKKKIVILGTGGTIAGTAKRVEDNVGYSAAQLGIASLIDAIPALAGGPCELLTEQLAQVDSKDMDFAVWQLLAQRVGFWLAQSDVAGLVISHGTDTLEETAYFLQALLNPVKPVVLVCAMRPATALLSDGPQNLLDAVAVAGVTGASGVVAVCAGVIHSALVVEKVHPYRLDAFDSGDAGPLGYVEEGRVRLTRPWPISADSAASAALRGIVNGGAEPAWPRVEIVMNYVGGSARVVDAMVADGVQGLVAAATGNGTLHKDLEAALLKAQAGGVAVVRATRCTQGQIVSGAENPLADSKGLSPVKARIALILQLLGRHA
jgi:L-asparaginase